jgi:hypothetical protein
LAEDAKRGSGYSEERFLRCVSRPFAGAKEKKKRRLTSVGMTGEDPTDVRSYLLDRRASEMTVLWHDMLWLDKCGGVRVKTPGVADNFLDG